MMMALADVGLGLDVAHGKCLPVVSGNSAKDKGTPSGVPLAMNREAVVLLRSVAANKKDNMYRTDRVVDTLIGRQMSGTGDAERGKEAEARTTNRAEAVAIRQGKDCVYLEREERKKPRCGSEAVLVFVPLLSREWWWSEGYYGAERELQAARPDGDGGMEPVIDGSCSARARRPCERLHGCGTRRRGKWEEPERGSLSVGERYSGVGILWGVNICCVVTI
ncbi:hypothetical protein EDB85DRAFT_2188437 [Lactarius pseudohatsudake]|nr:hypothetical protein EDB85DRAFT_2188437 [Lactarius pseudohatsudake]